MNWTRDTWTDELYGQLLEDLVSKADEDYRLFNSKLIPTEDTSLGVRIPVLRKMAVEIAKGNGAAFLDIPKGNCHEEILLEGFVLGRYRCGYDEFIRRTNSFCHRLTNWANCESVCASLMQVELYREAFFQNIPLYLQAEAEIVRRFGIILMMNYYLQDGYIDQVLERIDAIRDDRYYVSMAQAWLFATAWAKYRDKTCDCMRKSQLPDVTINRAIQKMRESNRVSKEDKEMVLRWKR